MGSRMVNELDSGILIIPADKMSSYEDILSLFFLVWLRGIFFSAYAYSGNVFSSESPYDHSPCLLLHNGCFR